MASKKEGGKNRKFGRHARNPSSANQAKRTERNKAERAQKTVHIPARTSHELRKLNKAGNLVYDTIEFRGVRQRVYCA